MNTNCLLCPPWLLNTSCVNFGSAHKHKKDGVLYIDLLHRLVKYPTNMVHGGTWASKSVFLVMIPSCGLEHLVITSICYAVFSMGWFWISWNECVLNIIWWLFIELELHAWSRLCEYGHICWNQLIYKHKVLLEGVE